MNNSTKKTMIIEHVATKMSFREGESPSWLHQLLWIYWTIEGTVLAIYRQYIKET